MRTGSIPLLIFALLSAALQGCAQTQAQEPAAAVAKRVVVDKTTQTLVAYEGDKVVIQSRVSTGRAGRRTPSGNFTAGEKHRMHYSRLYDNAPMPWSVQVNGNYFIHGFSSVPDRPASHGCIRMPLTGDNPAKRFFDWVEPGTPIVITGEWAGKPRPAQ
jgi:lipoprotein-anchoring transpeptidase ErfK/SrfK